MSRPKPSREQRRQGQRRDATPEQSPPTHPSRRPTATSPHIHTKRRRRRGSPGARSAADPTPASTRSTDEAGSPATSPRGRRPGMPRRSAAPTDGVPSMRLHGDRTPPAPPS
jgi:hypothetical protein